MAQRCQNSTKPPRVCHRCRARSAKGGLTSGANAKPTIPVSKAKPTPASPILTGSGRKKPWSSPPRRTPRQSLQLQEMASTCEDAVRRIDQLSAATQQLLKELGLSSVGGVGRSPSRTRPNPFADMCPVPTRTFIAAGAAQEPQEPTVPLPCLPTYSQPATARNMLQPSQVSIRAETERQRMFSSPSVAFQRLEQSLASYVPSPLSAGRMVVACGRCLDLRELLPAFASNMEANTAQRERIAEGLASRQISQELLNVYRRFDPTASELTWSHGRLRDFVKACFAELAVVSPTDSQIYMVYTHFDPELMMKLTALESISLVEVLLRASLGPEPPEPVVADESEQGLNDHPTLLAEQWVSQYVPLPVDGTISIAYSTGVVIHFPEFSEMLQSLANLNKPQRGNILYRIASCDLLRHALQVFKQCEDGTGYLTWSDRRIEGFVTEVFVQEGLVPPTAQHVAAFYDKFAELQPRLNASECLCLVDALFRALLHAGTDTNQKPTDPAAAHPHVEAYAAEEPASGSPDPGTQRENLATAALFAGDIREQEPLTAPEPKPIAAARAWVASVAHGLPFLEPLSGSHLSSAESFAELALQVYLEQPSALQGKLFYRGERQNEMESFLSALFQRASLALRQGQGLHPPASSLVLTVAEQIDLQGSGFLDVTQCLLLSDGLMRLAEKPGEDKLACPGKHRKGGAMGPFCAVSVAGAASPVLDERTPQGVRQHAPPVDQETLQQVASKAFMTCDQSGHGYLTWSEVRSFISMIFRGLGLVNHLTDSDIYKLYARFDEEHTARLGMDQCLRLARAAVPQSWP
eukprot:s1324_g22.t1